MEASSLSRRLCGVDPHYKSLVHTLANVMRSGTYNRAMMLDAVLLAEEIVLYEHFEKAIRNPPSDPTQRLNPIP